MPQVVESSSLVNGPAAGLRNREVLRQEETQFVVWRGAIASTLSPFVVFELRGTYVEGSSEAVQRPQHPPVNRTPLPKARQQVPESGRIPDPSRRAKKHRPALPDEGSFDGTPGMIRQGGATGATYSSLLNRDTNRLGTGDPRSLSLGSASATSLPPPEVLGQPPFTMSAPTSGPKHSLPAWADPRAYLGRNFTPSANKLGPDEQMRDALDR